MLIEHTIIVAQSGVKITGKVLLLPLIDILVDCNDRISIGGNFNCFTSTIFSRIC
jgi:hypothetical protein